MGLLCSQDLRSSIWIPNRCGETWGKRWSCFKSVMAYKSSSGTLPGISRLPPCWIRVVWVHCRASAFLSKSQLEEKDWHDCSQSCCTPMPSEVQVAQASIYTCTAYGWMAAGWMAPGWTTGWLHWKWNQWLAWEVCAGLPLQMCCYKNAFWHLGHLPITAHFKNIKKNLNLQYSPINLGELAAHSSWTE